LSNYFKIMLSRWLMAILCLRQYYEPAYSSIGSKLIFAQQAAPFPHNPIFNANKIRERRHNSQRAKGRKSTVKMLLKHYSFQQLFYLDDQFFSITWPGKVIRISEFPFFIYKEIRRDAINAILRHNC